ncbi:hypothetical protein OAory_01049790 [Aspergillus oryzae]|uniref:Aminoglycoside phosphotransferase domain-containing protein n=1 Tax=Aspergillus oryzae TaxID=5062 RepID=A0A1S9D4V7_ASPOZ|nr:hypothetical protein OAory_01049790 [Aspergillus oryzae]
MVDAAPAISFSASNAAQWNRDLMLAFLDALEKNPAADLMSMFSDSYIQGHRNAKYEQETETKGPPEFRTRLDLAESATVIYPLSDKVTAMLGQYSGGWLDNKSIDAEQSLIASLKQLIWDSPKIWESSVRGVVVKCNEDIVAKVITGSQTLAQAWPSLSHKEKISIQHQLDEIFCRLRTIRQDDGSPLGGVNGEGAKELRVDECTLFKNITTTKEFNSLQFSARHYGSTTYVKLLRSFLEYDNSTLIPGSVFTHGDVRTNNIMVKKEPSPSGEYIVTGIIGLEDSGFYLHY